MKLKSLPPLQNDFQTGLLKSLLSNENISFITKNDNLSSVYGFLPDFQEQILVSEQDYPKAIELIKEGFPEIEI